MRISPISVTNNNKTQNKSNKQNFGMYYKFTEAAQKDFLNELAKSVQGYQKYFNKPVYDDLSSDAFSMFRIRLENGIKFIRSLKIINSDNHGLFPEEPIFIESFKFKEKYKPSIQIRARSTNELLEFEGTSVVGDGHDYWHTGGFGYLSGRNALWDLRKEEELSLAQDRLLEISKAENPDKLAENILQLGTKG